MVGFFGVGLGFFGFFLCQARAFRVFSGFGLKNRAEPSPVFTADLKTKLEPARCTHRAGPGRVFLGRIGSGLSDRATREQV